MKASNSAFSQKQMPLPKQTITDVGILGGTFDPIHLGHINPAKTLLNWLGLKQVIFMPTFIPPHKKAPSVQPEQRAAMVKLVCQTETAISCDERELTRKTTSYTLDTLLEIKQQHPHQRIFFIIGMDSLLTFTQWHKWQEILTLCHLVVNTRPGYALEDMSTQTRQLLVKHKVDDVKTIKQRLAGGIIFAPASQWNISSSDIRQQLKSAADCQHLLPKSVLNYIKQHKLYLDP